MPILNIFLSLFFVSSSFAATDYFKSTYEESDQHFTEIYTLLRKTNPKASVMEFQYPQGTLKSFFFPAIEKQENLLIMISGTHGIEAFAGSAVQRYLLEQNLKLKKTAVLMVHGFNLFGFKNFRRVNENNIDLNRNFIIDRQGFKPDDESYSQLDGFLNPPSAPALNFFSRGIFLAKAVVNIARYSIESLRSSILKGQYTYPAGIFYGGSEVQAQAGLIEALIAEYIKPSFKKVFIVDLHTGYGERAKLHLLAGKKLDPGSQELLKIFSEDEIDFADKKKFYAVQGDMLSYFANRIRINSVLDTNGVTFEYGTLDSQKTAGSIESLRRVILENQNFLHPADEKSSAEIKSLYREMFYPSDLVWREAVLEQTDEKMKKVFAYLEN